MKRRGRRVKGFRQRILVVGGRSKSLRQRILVARGRSKSLRQRILVVQGRSKGLRQLILDLRGRSKSFRKLILDLRGRSKSFRKLSLVLDRRENSSGKLSLVLDRREIGFRKLILVLDRRENSSRELFLDLRRRSRGSRQPIGRPPGTRSRLPEVNWASSTTVRRGAEPARGSWADSREAPGSYRGVFDDQDSRVGGRKGVVWRMSPENEYRVWPIVQPGSIGGKTLRAQVAPRARRCDMVHELSSSLEWVFTTRGLSWGRPGGMGARWK